MEIIFLPIILLCCFLAVFCWKVYGQIENEDYVSAEKEVFSLAITMSIFSFAGLIIVGYEFFKFLILTLL